MSFDTTTNPFVGLRPYEVEESLLFFGRNEQILELLERLHKNHFVAVVGTSGCGKSSLLRAGLIPSLKAGYLLDNSDKWMIAIMKPGQSPIYNFAESLLQQLNASYSKENVSNLVKAIEEEGAEAIINLITPAWQSGKMNFFILVDQFEELFRFAMEQNDVARKDEAIDFVNIILELSRQTQVPIYIVITMRSDFIGDCARFYGMPEAMNKSQYLVPRLNRLQLKNAIESPAKLYGRKIDPTLISRLLNETGKIKDELPLLQHALMRIWDYEKNVNKSEGLDLKDYTSIGGIEKALSNHADEALEGMSEEERGITKEIFQALTAIDENGRKIRRPVLLSQLQSLTGAGKEQLMKIINLFIDEKRSFLIVNNTGDGDDKIIDISHESLIRQWDKLSKWVDEEGEYASNYFHLAEATKLNKAKRKDYLSGSELQIALDWYKTFKPVAAWANRYTGGFDDNINFLLESEKEWNKKQKLDKSSKQKQKILILGIGILLLGVIISIAVTWYNTELRKQSNKNEQEAILQKAIADSSLKIANYQKAQIGELLKITLNGRGEKYTNKDVPAIIKLLNDEQSLPIENLIEPKATHTLRPGYKDQTGRQIYDFLIWIEVPFFRLSEIRQVEYSWTCSGFSTHSYTGVNPSSGFAFNYSGWGYCPTIKISVQLVNGNEVIKNFRLGEYLDRNPG